jgi:uncharacterized protein YabE (DUF348 family)
MVPIVTFAVLIVAGFMAWWLLGRYDAPANNVYVAIISHDGEQQTVPSREPTVGALIQKLHIAINEGDVVEPSLNTHINQDDFRINIYRAVPVEIVRGTQHIYTFSAATTPRSIAEQAGLSLYPEDELTTAPTNNFVGQSAIGETVTVKPSVPIQLIVYGSPIITRSHSDTVGQILSEKHIQLHKGDSVQPAANTPVTPNMEVFILRKGTKIVTETQQVATPVQTINDSSLTVGTSAIRQYGSPGSLLLTYQVDEKTGAKTQLQSVLAQAPVTEIVVEGTAPVPTTASLSTWLDKLRTCESGGNYQDDTGNGFYGAYQFLESTWVRLGYTGLPSSASPALQDEAIIKNTNLSKSGLASQNPGCYYRTGISAFPPPS